MTMDSKATKRINCENKEELDRKWEEVKKGKEILREGEIRIAISEEGAIVSANVASGMILPVLQTLKNMDNEGFAAAMANIAAESFSGFLNELAKAFDDDSEEADSGDDDESDSDSDSSDGEKDNTPEAE